MQVERLHEAVKVRADFQGGQITPVLFKRGVQDYRVLSVNARWEDREGQQRICYFSVTADTGDIYYLQFSTHEMLWHIDSVVMDG